MSDDRLFEPPLEIPPRIPMPTPDGRWAIDEWRDDAWFSLTRASGYEDHVDAQADVDKLNAGGATCRVRDRGAR